MEEVEQQRLQHERHAVEPFEVDVLERRQRDRVLDVIEDLGVLAAFHPPLELLREPAREDVGQREQPALIGIERVQRLDLFIERLIIGAGHRVLPARLDEHLHEREQELQIGRRGRQTERIDREARSVQAPPAAPGRRSTS